MNIKSRTFFYFSILITLFIFVGLIYFINPIKVLKALSMLNLRFVLIAFAIYPISFILRGIRFELIMKSIKSSTSYRFAIMAIAISQTLNVLTPVRVGDLGRAYIYNKRGISYQSSFSGLAAERIYDVIAILSIAFLSIIFVSLKFFNILIYATSFLLLILVVVIILSKMKGYVAKIMFDAKNIIFSRDLVKYLPLSICIWTVDVITCYIILRSFANLPIFLPAFGVAAGNIAKILPITPGGIGTYEATLTLILSTKIPENQALVVSFVDHGIKNISTLLLGLFSSVKLGISFRDVRV